jgi:EAL domain-containing protein (putative c-di-GMP-specific phosphodiesterase class I)/DNA-binding response OmpR family regulator
VHRETAIRPPRSRAAHATQIPLRTGDLRLRGERLCEGNWDVNAALLLAEDAEALASTCRLLRNPATANRLEDFAECLWALLDPPVMPDSAALAGVATHLATLDGSNRREPGAVGDYAGEQTTLFGYAAAEDNGFPLLVRPPPDYFRRLAAIPMPGRPAAPAAEEPATVAPFAPFAPAAPAAPAAPVAAIAEPAKPAPAPLQPDPDPAMPATKAAEAKIEAEPAADSSRRRAVHLGDAGELATEINLQLRAQGYELELPANVNELKNLLSRSTPSLVVLGGSFQDDIDEIGAMVRSARARADQRVLLVALTTGKTDLAARLRAMRAGCDAFVAHPASADEVLSRVRELNAAEHADPFRIMIVEDDRSQALFAESILRKNGMEALAVTEASAVLDKLDEFRPDLILMDLNMPVCNGMELTALIREREANISTPIVFLSGEGDTEKHFAAISAGGDDFLTKPIAPRHLITAVTSRVRRARLLERRRTPTVRDAVKGLLDSAKLARRLTEMLSMEDAATRDGGLLSIELDAAPKLHDRVGATQFRKLVEQLTNLLCDQVGSNGMLARCGDSGYLLLNPDRSAKALGELADRLRDVVAGATFGDHGAPLPVSIVVGICPFSAGAGDAKAMIDAAQQAMGKAQSVDGRGIHMVEAAVDESARDVIIDAIRLALEDSSFRVVFQPIVSLHGEEEEQFQALLRLSSGEDRVYAASELVPAAERAGLIAEVDRWMLDSCLGTIAEHLRDGRNLRLFVSQSSSSVRDPGRVEWMRNALNTHRVPAAQISLEMRLADASSALAEYTAFCQAMKQLGVSLTLAGVEAGAQTREMLAHLPVDYIKLSPRYTSDPDETLRNELRDLVAFAHDSGRRVIAPRVEEARVAASLWSSGIDLIQGNFVQQATRETSYDFQAANG